MRKGRKKKKLYAKVPIKYIMNCVSLSVDNHIYNFDVIVNETERDALSAGLLILKVTYDKNLGIYDIGIDTCEDKSFYQNDDIMSFVSRSIAKYIREILDGCREDKEYTVGGKSDYSISFIRRVKARIEAYRNLEFIDNTKYYIKWN